MRLETRLQSKLQSKVLNATDDVKLKEDRISATKTMGFNCGEFYVAVIVCVTVSS